MKRFITLLLAILMVTTLILVFTSCDSNTETDNNTTNSTKETVGVNSIFQTEDVNEYLTFLENFDKTTYEIIDISTGKYATHYSTRDYYMVTYKKIAE